MMKTPPTDLPDRADQAPAADDADRKAPAADAAAMDPAFKERADIRTQAPIVPAKQKPGEIGGGDKPEPTRFGDWEVNGRCSDF